MNTFSITLLILINFPITNTLPLLNESQLCNTITLRNIDLDEYLHESTDNEAMTRSTKTEWRFIMKGKTRSGNQIVLIQNVDSGRNLDYDSSDNQVDTSVNSDDDKRWELIETSKKNVFYIRNIESGKYLDADSDERLNVDGSDNKGLDKQWVVECY